MSHRALRSSTNRRLSPSQLFVRRAVVVVQVRLKSVWHGTSFLVIYWCRNAFSLAGRKRPVTTCSLKGLHLPILNRQPRHAAEFLDVRRHHSISEDKACPASSVSYGPIGVPSASGRHRTHCSVFSAPRRRIATGGMRLPARQPWPFPSRDRRHSTPTQSSYLVIVEIAQSPGPVLVRFFKTTGWPRASRNAGIGVEKVSHGLTLIEYGRRRHLALIGPLERRVINANLLPKSLRPSSGRDRHHDHGIAVSQQIQPWCPRIGIPPATGPPVLPAFPQSWWFSASWFSPKMPHVRA